MRSTKHAALLLVTAAFLIVIVTFLLVIIAFEVLTGFYLLGGDSSQTLQLPPAKFCQLKFKFEVKIIELAVS